MVSSITIVACGACSRTLLAYPPVMSIETAVSREARANRRGSSSLPGPSHAPGMPSPAGTVGHRPNGTMIAATGSDDAGAASAGDSAGGGSSTSKNSSAAARPTPAGRYQQRMQSRKALAPRVSRGEPANGRRACFRPHPQQTTYSGRTPQPSSRLHVRSRTVGGHCNCAGLPRSVLGQRPARRGGGQRRERGAPRSGRGLCRRPQLPRDRLVVLRRRRHGR